MTLHATPIPILKDNYAWLLQDGDSGATALVDPAEAAPLIAAIAARGGRLDLILLTHHHADHVAGTEEVRARFGCAVAGARDDADRLPPLDIALGEGEEVTLGTARGRVIATPGHTRGHIAWFFPAGPLVACGDTLFSLGCGRLFEGKAEDMFASLAKLTALPGETLVCCGHEYTLANARFARSVDPDNAALHARVAEAERQRAAGLPTVPTTIALERATNPFLRAADAATLGMLRARKDNF